MSDEKKKPATYVVQVWCAPVTAEQQAALEAEGFPAPTGELPSTWMDIATVTVPGGTNRKTVLKKALAEAGMTPRPGEAPPRLRALDSDSAAVHEPKVEWTL